MDTGLKASASEYDKGTRNVGIFWDVATCPFPAGHTDGDDIAANVSKAVGQHVGGNVAEFCAYGHFSTWPKSYLKTDNATFLNFPDWRARIVPDIYLCPRNFPNSAPWTMLLLSSDADLIAALLTYGRSPVQRMKGYDLALAVCPGTRVSDSVLDFGLGLRIWDWPSLATGKGVVPAWELIRDASCNRNF